METSKIKMNDLNPVYNERFTLPAAGDSAGLIVTVWDYESLGGHQLIGRALVPLDSLRDGRLTEMMLKLDSPQNVKVSDDGSDEEEKEEVSAKY